MAPRAPAEAADSQSSAHALPSLRTFLASELALPVPAPSNFGLAQPRSPRFPPASLSPASFSPRIPSTACTSRLHSPTPPPPFQGSQCSTSPEGAERRSRTAIARSDESSIWGRNEPPPSMDPDAHWRTPSSESDPAHSLPPPRRPPFRTSRSAMSIESMLLYQPTPPRGRARASTLSVFSNRRLISPPSLPPPRSLPPSPLPPVRNICSPLRRYHPLPPPPPPATPASPPPPQAVASPSLPPPPTPSSPPAFAFNVLRPSRSGGGFITSAPVTRARTRAAAKQAQRGAGPSGSSATAASGRTSSISRSAPSTSVSAIASTSSTPRTPADEWGGGGRRHECAVCHKRFNRPSSLRTHSAVHTGARPHVCPVRGCGKAFSVPSNMRRHMRRHRRERRDEDVEDRMDEGEDEGEGGGDDDDDREAEDPDVLMWTPGYEGPSSSE